MAQSLTLGTGSLWRVEGEVVGCGLLVGDSRDRTHEALAVVAHLATVLIHEHD